MTDREKVITALAICSGKCKCFGCWYKQNNPDFRCQDQLMADAHDLLLKQEPVKPIKIDEFYYCGSCRYALMHVKQKYCINCGKEPEWNEE